MFIEKTQKEYDTALAAAVRAGRREKFYADNKDIAVLLKVLKHVVSGYKAEANKILEIDHGKPFEPRMPDLSIMQERARII